jgi:hypothetical protein
MQITPAMAAALFSNTRRLSSAVSRQGIHALIRTGQRHQSVMLVLGDVAGAPPKALRSAPHKCAKTTGFRIDAIKIAQSNIVAFEEAAGRGVPSFGYERAPHCGDVC